MRRQPITTQSVSKWSPEVEETIRDCFDTTAWSVLLESHGEDIEGVTQCLTEYMNFCMDTVVPVRTVSCFPNNKPWVTSEVKAVLNKNKKAFKNRNHEEMRQVQRELNLCLKEAMEEYRRKLESKLRENYITEIWKKL